MYAFFGLPFWIGLIVGLAAALLVLVVGARLMIGRGSKYFPTGKRA